MILEGEEKGKAMTQENHCFGVGPVTHRSMPFWCVQYRGVDPFGCAIAEEIDSLQTAEIIVDAMAKGLIEMTAAHDDDLVPWNPNDLEDDLDRGGPVYKRIITIGEDIKIAGGKFHTITCNLHGNPIFRKGGLTNSDPAIRQLARAKVERTLRIGSVLGARRFIYWVARDGAEVGIVVHPHVMKWITSGLNAVTDYINEYELDYEMGSIEPKPSEPRANMFLPTAGHAAAFTQTLDRPNFWMVNPELTQHEGMTGLDPVTCVRNLIHLGKLGFLHFGNQAKGKFDNDFVPLTGPEGLKETVDMFRVLGQLGWKGVVEFDCHPLRTDLQTGASDSLRIRREFIEDCSNGLGIALALADRLDNFDTSGMSDSRADLSAIMKMCGLRAMDTASFIKRK